MQIKTIALTREAARKMRHEANAWAPLESGGLLIGRLAQDLAHVHVATEPGPHAEHMPNGFMRDGGFSQDRLDEVVRTSHGEWDYIGEWHSHPLDVPASGPDARSMREIAEDPLYLRARPLLLVLLPERRRWVFRGYQWRGNRLVEVGVRS